MRLDSVRLTSVVGRFAAVAALVFVSATQAAASPLTYIESISGDLGEILGLKAPLAFDLGTNSVSGTILFGSSVGVDLDSFAFTLPVEGLLTNINFAFTTTAAPGTTNGTLDYTLRVGNSHQGQILATQRFDLFAPSPGPVFGAKLPRCCLTYGLDFDQTVINGGGGYTLDYTWTFTVIHDPTVVPEPVTAVLFATGLVPWMARRRNRARMRR